MTEVLSFYFRADARTLSFRVVVCADEPWFALDDACAALGIGDPRRAFYLLDDDERDHAEAFLPGIGTEKFAIVSRTGFHRLILLDNQRNRPLEKWLYRQVVHENCEREREQRAAALVGAFMQNPLPFLPRDNPQ